MKPRCKHSAILVAVIFVASSAIADAVEPPSKGMPIQKVWPRRSSGAAAAAPLIGAPPLLLRAPSEKRAVPAPFAAKLDINTATLEQLQNLPGVGLVWAPKLLAGRPYKSLGDLARDGIPFNTIDRIAPLITLEP